MMQAIKVVPKMVQVVAPKSVEFKAVTWRTMDDSFGRRLQVVVNNLAPIVVSGADYDALGQWTDDDIKALVLARLELVEATPV